MLTIQRLMPLALFVVPVFTSLFLSLGLQAGSVETPEEAIKRIQGGRYTAMPPATAAPASGLAGKGMTIENGTGQTLHVHFSGPMHRTVVVPNGRSESVELAVGNHQVAAEVPGSKIVPFYGRQAYQSFTHYWLKFHTQRVGSPDQSPSRSQDPPGRDPSATTKTEAPRTYKGSQIIVHNVNRMPLRNNSPEQFCGNISPDPGYDCVVIRTGLRFPEGVKPAADWDFDETARLLDEGAQEYPAVSVVVVVKDGRAVTIGDNYTARDLVFKFPAQKVPTKLRAKDIEFDLRRLGTQQAR